MNFLLTLFLIHLLFACSLFGHNYFASASDVQNDVLSGLQHVLKENKELGDKLELALNHLDIYSDRLNNLEKETINSRSVIFRLQNELQIANARIENLRGNCKNSESRLSKLEAHANPTTNENPTVTETANNVSVPFGLNVQHGNKRMVPAGQIVAFSASMNIDNDYMKIGETVRFDAVTTNIGFGYNPVTNVFQAPVSGLYYFNAIIMSRKAEDIQTEIVKNGQEVVRIFSGDSATFGVGMQSSIMYLHAADRVWIRIVDNPVVNDGNIRIFGLNWSSFSGFLIGHY